MYCTHTSNVDIKYNVLFSGMFKCMDVWVLYLMHSHGNAVTRTQMCVSVYSTVCVSVCAYLCGGDVFFVWRSPSCVCVCVALVCVPPALCVWEDVGLREGKTDRLARGGRAHLSV